MTEFRSNAVIALGANLPFDGFAADLTLRKAIQSLVSNDVVIRSVSSFYSTPCFPPGAGPDYINAAISVNTILSPVDLLGRLHEVEQIFGRERVQRWGMRTLDLDLICYEDLVLPDERLFREWLDLPPDQQVRAAPEQLILPHPRLQDRAFALVPMADVAPDWVHPVLGKSVVEMVADLPPEDVIEVIALDHAD